MPERETQASGQNLWLLSTANLLNTSSKRRLQDLRVVHAFGTKMMFQVAPTQLARVATIAVISYMRWYGTVNLRRWPKKAGDAR